MGAKRELTRAAHVLTLHLPGGLNFDHPRSNVVVGIVADVRGGFVFDHSYEVIAVEEAGDWDGGTGAREVGDEVKGGIAKL
jgi:hypothetical protein